MRKQNLQSSRQNNRPNTQIDRSFLSHGSKPFRLTLSRCCSYSENSNTPALDLPHGFLLDKGVFTKIDSPGAVRTQPFGINNWGQIVGFYLGAKVEDRRIIRGFLLDNSVFTTIEASDTTAPSTIVSDINDHGQLVGAYDLIIHGYLRDEHG